MTTAERKALLFLAAVATLGAGARLVATPRRADTPASRAALAHQLAAVDSARAARPPRDRARPRAPRPRPARRDSMRATSTRGTPQAPGGPPVDVDVADSAALEGLPGVGPALARRILEERARGGAFGSLAGLQEVRGVGPRLAARLAPYVTFSGMPRPSSAAARRPP
jgi:competence protein ComEA